jgi:hypothetical protein
MAFLTIGNWSQPTATVLACFCGFRTRSICHRLPPLAPARLHRRSIPVAEIPAEKADFACLEYPGWRFDPFFREGVKSRTARESAEACGGG